MNNNRVIIMEWNPISLVVPEKQDVELWYKWVNNIEIQSYLLSMFWTIISKESEEKYFESLNKDDKELTFSIYINDEGKVIWNISLMNINYKNSHTELWIAIFDKDNQNKWYWSKSIQLIQKYVFEVLWLNKLYLRYISTNNRAWKVYSKLWFIEKGRLKDHHYTMWEYNDEVYMELMHKEFLNNKY